MDADLVVVGGGLAGVTLVRALRRGGDQRSIAMIGSEADRPYDRPPLSKQILLGTMDLAEIDLFETMEDVELHVDLHLATPALHLRSDALTIDLPDGQEITGSDIVIATGARPKRLPGVDPGSGIHYLRSRGDAVRLRDEMSRLPHGGRVVVIGAGFIGLEVAAVARQRGHAVTVLESAALPLVRVLGESAGVRVAELHRLHGVDLRCAVQVTEIRRGANTIQVDLLGGDSVDADLVVIGIGVNPCVRWLDGSGVHIDDGVVCDGHGRSSRPHVWAAGDCARWPNATTGQHHRVEQWQAALDQAQVVAANLIHSTQAQALDSWTSVPYFWSDQYDMKIQFAGYPGGEPQDVGEAIGFRDGERATGLLTFNDPRLLARGRKVLLTGGSWSELAALGS